MSRWAGGLTGFPAPRLESSLPWFCPGIWQRLGGVALGCEQNVLYESPCLHSLRLLVICPWVRSECQCCFE